MDNLETQTTLVTQDTGQINVIGNQGNNKYGQSRETNNIGYTETGQINVTENIGSIKYGQSRDTDNIGYTRHRTNKRDRKPREH